MDSGQDIKRISNLISRLRGRVAGMGCKKEKFQNNQCEVRGKEVSRARGKRIKSKTEEPFERMNLSWHQLID